MISLKPEVREIAKELKLERVFQKKDSTGVCFIGERNFKQFLSNYLPAKQGDIVDIVRNKVIARHDGILYYTVGQHRGLNIGGIKGQSNDPYFVVGKDLKKNVLFVAQEKDNRYRFSSKCQLKSFNWIGSDLKTDYDCFCKFRYRGVDMPVKLIKEGDDYYLTYNDYSYVAKGQIAVLYQGERCLGSGIIEKTYDEKGIEIPY